MQSAGNLYGNSYRDTIYAMFNRHCHIVHPSKVIDGLYYEFNPHHCNSALYTCSTLITMYNYVIDYLVQSSVILYMHFSSMKNR